MTGMICVAGRFVGLANAVTVEIAELRDEVVETQAREGSPPPSAAMLDAITMFAGIGYALLGTSRR
jgi:hypothetical protein